MKNEYFSLNELPSTGTRVVSVVEYSGVPRGTEGVVIGNWQICGGKEYGIEIKWKRFPDDTLTDGFSKTDYEMGLKEL